LNGKGSGGNLWVNSQEFIPLDELAVDYAARIERFPQKASFNPLMFVKSKTSIYTISPHYNQQILPYSQEKFKMTTRLASRKDCAREKLYWA